MASVFPFSLGLSAGAPAPARVDFGGSDALHVGCDWIQPVEFKSGGTAWDLSATTAFIVELRESERSTTIAVTGSVLTGVTETDLPTGKLCLRINGDDLDATAARRQYWLSVTATAGGYDFPLLNGTLEVRGHRAT